MPTVQHFASCTAIAVALSAPAAVSPAKAQTGAPTFDRTVLPIQPLPFAGRSGRPLRFSGKIDRLDVQLRPPQ